MEGSRLTFQKASDDIRETFKRMTDPLKEVETKMEGARSKFQMVSDDIRESAKRMTDPLKEATTKMEGFRSTFQKASDDIRESAKRMADFNARISQIIQPMTLPKFEPMTPPPMFLIIICYKDGV